MPLYKPDRQRKSEAHIEAITSKALKLPPPIRGPIDELLLLPRSRPMRVLCLGMSRTGTLTLYPALTMLGYHPHHSTQALSNAAISLPCWKQALEAKYYGKGKAFGREEFDKLLGDYDAVLDFPCILFAEELIKAYPDARVVLTERPEDEWLVSIKKTIVPIWNWKWWPVAWADPVLVRPFVDYGRVVISIVPFLAANSHMTEHLLIDAYARHNEHIRQICPRDRLLQFKAGMGFQELCRFLGEPIPAEPYPKVNDSASFMAIHRAMWWSAAHKAGAKMAFVTLTLLVAIVGGRNFSGSCYEPNDAFP